MWISRRLAQAQDSEKAERGVVSMSENGELEVGSSVKARGVGSFSPYGYSADIPSGEEVLLVPSNDGYASLGCKNSSDGLEAGEIKISSKGGASIVLKNDGRVIINSHFVIDGEGNGKYV